MINHWVLDYSSGGAQNHKTGARPKSTVPPPLNFPLQPLLILFRMFRFSNRKSARRSRSGEVPVRLASGCRERRKESPIESGVLRHCVPSVGHRPPLHQQPDRSSLSRHFCFRRPGGARRARGVLCLDGARDDQLGAERAVGGQERRQQHSENPSGVQVDLPERPSEMTYIVSSGALNSTHSRRFGLC